MLMGAHAIPPSKQYSDSLFHFAKESFLISEALQRSSFTLNYVEEDFRYLGIPDLHLIAFPMLCFCDILEERARQRPHEERYGRYAIALKKDWGRKVGVQPVHYIVDTSPFTDDLRSAFEIAVELDGSEGASAEKDISNFLVTVFAYAKPAWDMENSYCFEDECEWRYVPKELPNLPTFIPSPTKGALENYRQTIRQPSTFQLKFSYEDIDSILVPTDRSSSAISGSSTTST